MKKSEAEPAIRYLCHEWFETLADDVRERPSFSRFKTWLENDHDSLCLSFRSSMGADYDTEKLFDQELRQSWRN